MSDCDVIMPDGRWLTLRASLMPQPGETQALHVPEGPHKKRLHGAIWEARMTEPQLISQPAGKRVSLEVCQPRQPQQPEPAPRHTAPGSNGHGDANGKTIPDADASLLAWPAILADRAVRGLWQTTQAKTIALGTSSDWLQGELETSAAQQASLRQLCQVADLGPCELFVPPPVDQAGAALHQQVRAAHPQLILRELENLCCLNGQPQANASVRRAHIWFPVLCGAAEPDRLLSLEIILRRHRYAEGQSDEFIIDGKVTSSQRNEIKTILNSLRQHDQHGVGEWRTLVRMPQDAISGQSYQLALALADRLARGRDFCGTGKIIASGQMMPPDASLPDGRVIEVEGIAAKCQLIASHLQAGMRILLPAASSACVQPDFLAKVKLAGASCGFVADVLN